MRNLIAILFLLTMLTACGGGSSGGGGAAALAPACGSFIFADEMLAATYTGTTVTTVGACDNAGQEYIIDVDGDYLFGASITGWRLINSNLDTQAGDIAFATGGRFMTADGVNEGTGLTFAGIDNTVCQGVHGVNGSADQFVVNVTAEFDSNCDIQLRGTFTEYAQCLGGNPDVTICSGTITLVR